MMHIVCSYGTFDAVKQGIKTCTRRRWKDSHAAKFHKGDLVGILNHSHRHRRSKGEPEMLIRRLTCDPYRERLADMPEEDVRAEGDLWPNKWTFIHDCFRDGEEVVWVVRWGRARLYKTAKGILPWKPGDELPEDVIRRGHDYVRGGKLGDE